MFGATLSLLPQRSTNTNNIVRSQITQTLNRHILEEFIKPKLQKAFHEYLGCQNVQYKVVEAIASGTAPNDDVVNVTDLQMGYYFDADAGNGDGEGIVVGLCLFSMNREERELVALLRQTLEKLDKEGVLRRKGKAVCLICCKGVAGIWVYGEEGG